MLDFKEYFRWYAVIFHIIVINLQETDLYSVCIPCLNDHSTTNGNWYYDRFTVQGISFDGMMPHACHFPLGKTQETKEKPWKMELIKPIDEMVSFLEVKKIKEGYTLSNLLTRTCFVYGDEIIYQQFVDKVESILKEDANSHKVSIMEQLEEDYNKFDLTVNFSFFTAEKTVNIKDILYKSITLFVSALGRLQGCNLKSSFEIIKQLHESQVVSDFGKIMLSHAVAVACHVRLFQYMSKGRHEDKINSESERWGQEKMIELTQIVSKDIIIASIVTAFTLQQILKYDGVMKISNFDEIWNRYNLPLQVMFLILLGLFDDILPIGELYFETEKQVFDEFDATALIYLGHAYMGVMQHQKCLNLYEKCKPKLKLPSKHQNLFTTMKCNELYCHYFLGNIFHVLRESNVLLKTELLDSDLHEVLRLNGLSKFALKKYEEALGAYRDLFKKYQRAKTSWEKDINFAMNMRIVSLCLIKTGRKQQGLHLAYEGLNFLEMNGATSDNNVMFTQIIETPDRNVNFPF